MEMESEYYDDDYGELFTAYILNMSAEDLANVTSLVYRNESQGPDYPDEEALLHSFKPWLFALNIVAGVGILTNSILSFMIIVDFIIDASRRCFTRHWLLLNSSLTHVAFLAVSIYFKEFGISLLQLERECLILQHTEKTLEFVTVLDLILLAVNVLGNILRPTIRCGPRSFVFWIMLVLFLLVCANLTILALFTMKIDGLFDKSTSCLPDASLALLVSRLDIYSYILPLATFYLPHGILLSLSFSSLLCYCSQRRKLTLASSNVNDYYSSRKRSAIFIFITSTAGFLLMLPFYLYQIPAVTAVALIWFNVRYQSPVLFLTVLIKLLFYVLFPVVCLCLTEVKQIYRKVTSK